MNTCSDQSNLLSRRLCGKGKAHCRLPYFFSSELKPWCRCRACFVLQMHFCWGCDVQNQAPLGESWIQPGACPDGGAHRIQSVWLGGHQPESPDQRKGSLCNEGTLPQNTILCKPCSSCAYAQNLMCSPYCLRRLSSGWPKRFRMPWPDICKAVRGAIQVCFAAIN